MSEAIRKVLAFRSIGMQSFGFAFHAIWSQKLRSALTLLGIVAGVATVIAMVSLVVGFNRKVMEAYQTFGASQVCIQKYDYGEQNENGVFKPRRNLQVEDAEAIQRLAPMAAHVSPERYVLVGVGITVKSPKGKEIQAGTITGGLPAYAPVNNFNVSDGRFITDSDVRHAAKICVLGATAARALFPGSDPMFETVFIKGESFKVIGLLEAKGKMFGNDPDNLLIVPITAFDDVFPEIKNGDGETLFINAIPKEATGSEALKDQCTAVMRSRRGLRPGDANDFQISTSESDLKSFQKFIDAVAAVMLFIASIALVVAGVGVMNIMLVSVTERTREIGVRKAMGATRKNIAAQFLVEAVTLTGVGGGLGILLGLAVAMLVKLGFDFPAAAPLWSIVLGFGVSTTVGLTFGLWPAVRAARKDPIEALRYE